MLRVADVVSKKLTAHFLKLSLILNGIIKYNSLPSDRLVIESQNTSFNGNYLFEYHFPYKDKVGNCHQFNPC